MYGFVWIWTGDETKANPELIPSDLAYLSSPTGTLSSGLQAVNANFMQLKENVLDLTHFAFLHKKSLGVTDWDRPPAVEVTATRVTFRQIFDMAPLPAVYAVPAGAPSANRSTAIIGGALLSAGAHHGAVDMHDPSSSPEDSSGSRCASSISRRRSRSGRPTTTGRSPRSWRSIRRREPRARRPMSYSARTSPWLKPRRKWASFDRS